MKRQFIIIHPSEIVRQGLYSILRRYYNYEIIQYDTYKTINKTFFNQETENIFFYDFNYVVNQEIPREIKSLTNTKFICIHCDQVSSSYQSCHETIKLNTNTEEIVTIIDDFFKDSNKAGKSYQDKTLSTRETEVLRYLSTGLSNKEIADRLNISTHTIISHRKNLIEKLGIKSVSGLTVYAILNKIIDIQEISS